MYAIDLKPLSISIFGDWVNIAVPCYKEFHFSYVKKQQHYKAKLFIKQFIYLFIDIFVLHIQKDMKELQHII